MDFKANNIKTTQQWNMKNVWLLFFAIAVASFRRDISATSKMRFRQRIASCFFLKKQRRLFSNHTHYNKVKRYAIAFSIASVLNTGLYYSVALAEERMRSVPSFFSRSMSFSEWHKELIWCAKNGKDRYLKKLVQNYDYNVNRKDKNGWNALHYAIYHDHCGVIRILLENGARSDIPVGSCLVKSVCACLCKKLPALHLAARLNRYQAAKILLEHGADPEFNVAIDSWFKRWLLETGGCDACTIARNAKSDKIAKLIREHDSYSRNCEEVPF